ncbi:unnamed protein product [Didymodactylos carnosus]|uniref:Uncharacterized protein n=1 Tax=Didymodactylos carnosus TaxID=1234261 RepID=A0A814IB07_9BILA|nr:unnamed protein product [Didymodactylos carnosus]CAF3791887.1 unnamed protein product [Didymodactylos carnosus]
MAKYDISWRDTDRDKIPYRDVTYQPMHRYALSASRLHTIMNNIGTTHCNELADILHHSTIFYCGSSALTSGQRAAPPRSQTT